jgi:signal transduction histidine kinase
MDGQIWQLEERIKELEGHLKLTQQIGKIGTWEVNLETLNASWTDEIYEIFRVPHGSLKPNMDSYLSHVHPDDRIKVAKELNASQKTKQPFDLHHRIILPDGTVKYVSLKARFVMDSNNKPLRITGVVQDITERINFENDLRTAKEKAEESNKLKSNFLQNMSHEIRTPMNGVMGFCQLLIKKDDIPPEKQKQYLQTIYNSCKLLLTVINDILDISKIDAGIIQIHYNEFNINTFIDETFEQFKHEASKNKINLHTIKELDNASCNVISDKSLLNKVLCNY